MNVLSPNLPTSDAQVLMEACALMSSRTLGLRSRWQVGAKDGACSAHKKKAPPVITTGGLPLDAPRYLVYRLAAGWGAAYYIHFIQIEKGFQHAN